MDESITTAGPLHRQLGLLQARLLQAFPTPRFTHDLVPARLDSRAWLSMVGRAPFIGISWLGITPRAARGRIYDGDAKWRLFLVAENARPALRFAGDARNIGLFGLVQAATIFLHGYSPPAPEKDLEAEGTFEVGEINNAFGVDWVGDNGACATVDIDTPIRMLHDYRAEDFLQLAATWPAEDNGSAPFIIDSHDVRNPA